MGVAAYAFEKLFALGEWPRACLEPDERNPVQGIVLGCMACLPFWIGVGVLTLTLT